MRFDAADPATYPSTVGPWLVRYSSPTTGQSLSMLPWFPFPWDAAGPDRVWVDLAVAEYVRDPFDESSAQLAQSSTPST